ncbi:MAG TPA: hypothetical protein VLD39_16725 [Gammaproteobacteria bacterium]|nr:hypothetical protein [Gammaproteobacteria bacterium]
MMRSTIPPAHDDLRRAVQWLAERGNVDAQAIEEASVRFDLSPRDEEFLLAHFAAAVPVPRSRSS